MHFQMAGWFIHAQCKGTETHKAKSKKLKAGIKAQLEY